MAPIQLELLDPGTQLPQIRAIWTRLSDAQDVGYFLSWGWMEHWLSTLPAETSVRLAVVSERDAPRAAFFLGAATTERHRFLRSRGLFLNTTGLPEYDQLCIEYNAILSDGTLTCSLREILDCLPHDWEEFVMPAMNAAQLPDHWLNGSAAPYTVLIHREAPSPYVDLEAVRRRDGDYPALLGAATRANIRRSYRLLASAYGPVRCEAAGTLSHALDTLQEMAHLHQRTWEKRGQVGAFASEYFRGFHIGLVTKRFDAGEIQLLRIMAGTTTLGCLYNFVFHGTVSFYQSGINYQVDPRVKPGLVCHAEAVRRNAQTSHRVYDFLGGQARYKANLSTHASRLMWVTVQKPHPKFWMERTLRAAKRAVRWSWSKPIEVGADP